MRKRDSSSSKVKKKKGPKGKQARAKAKLDRQWGEQVDEAFIEKSKYRKGKSRLLQYNNSNKKTTKSFQNQNENVENHPVKDDPHASSSSSSFDSDDNDSDMDDMYGKSQEEAEENALHSLLQNIQKKQGKKQNKTKLSQEENDSDEEMEDDDESIKSVSSNHVDDDSSFSNDDDDNDDDREDTNTTTKASGSFIDPFENHFGQQLTDEEIVTKYQTIQKNNQQKSCLKPQETPNLNEALQCFVVNDGDDSTNNSNQNIKQPLDGVKEVLQESWKHINKQVKRHNVDRSLEDNANENRQKQKKSATTMSNLQQTVWPHIQSYKDILVTAETWKNHNALSNLWSLHVLNHVLTSRTRIQKHDRKIKATSSSPDDDTTGNTATNQNNDNDDDHIHRDQGFTRPTVLILLPTRGTCFKFVQRMGTLLGSKDDDTVIDGMERFEMEYGVPDSMDDNEEDDNDEKERKIKQRRKVVLQQKGKEWQDMFGDDVNVDDDFKIGMSLYPKKSKGKKVATSGASLRLYTDFYSSDIIITSPLALKSAVMVSSQKKNKNKNKGRNKKNSKNPEDMMDDDNMVNGDEDNDNEDGDIDTDFLSSIELCLVLHSDVLLMQNWDHVNDAMELMNHLPKKNNDTDFSRVRNYLLAGYGMHWRQLIVSSTFLDPLVSSTFERYSKCIAGKFKIRRRTLQQDDDEGNNGPTITNVLCKVKQVFQRVPCKSFAQQGHDRLQYFTDTILPQLMRLKKKHTLIYIPSYFDFVSVRNLLLKREANFVSVTEYARVSEVSRGRARFLQGRKQIMLYTGRAHFFQRHLIKGIRHIIFFGLPEHAEFYSGMLNTLNQGFNVGSVADDDSHDEETDLESPSSCLSIFTKYEAHALERIVGRKNCERMVKREKNTFIFSS